MTTKLLTIKIAHSQVYGHSISHEKQSLLDGFALCPQCPAPQTWKCLVFIVVAPSPTYERQRKFISNVHADLIFQACISFLKWFRASGTPTRKILVCIRPSMPSNMQIGVSF